MPTDSGSANGTKAKLAYDPSGRLNQVVNTTSANVTLSSYDYALDGIGNLSSAVEDGTRPINWSTDSLNQITSDYYFSSLTSESWMRMILDQWDSFTLADWDALPLDSMTSIVSGSNQLAYSPAGNRTTRIEQASGDTTTYAYSPTNRLTAADDITGRTTYTYDSNGNVLTIEEPSGDLTTNTWDGENRLVQVEHPDGAITTYSYNADGLRVEEDHDGVIKRLVYDGNNVQLETDDVGDLLVDNTYVPNNYGLALSQRRDGDSSFYLADGTQDVRQLTDSVQSVTDEYEFDAWGNSLSSTGGTPNAQQYKGQQLAYRADPDAGPELQYALHFRQYDPHTARFTSRDPAEDDLNLYRYVKNNPVNNVDPSGLDPTREALDVVDKLLTEQILKLKFLGGLAYGVFVNELWGTAVDAVEGAGSQIKAGAKLGSFVARSVYGYYGGDTAAMRAAEDAVLEQFTTVEQAAEFFEQAGPTMAAIFSDIAPNGTLDGLEPETIAFIEAIKPELEEIQGILVAKWQKATAEDIAWKLGEIVAPILLGAATMGVGMVAQGGKLA